MKNWFKYKIPELFVLFLDVIIEIFFILLPFIIVFIVIVLSGLFLGKCVIN